MCEPVGACESTRDSTRKSAVSCTDRGCQDENEIFDDVEHNELCGLEPDLLGDIYLMSSALSLQKPSIEQRSERPSRVRYRVLGLGVCLSMITYLDRVCISITAPKIIEDLSLTKLQMSFVFSAFTLAYGLFEIPTGWWGDRIGTRKVLTRIVVWWSVFTMATAGALNYVSLLIVRFLFGAGEAGAWPNAARTFSRWFPATERGTAQGIFFMGAHLGGGLTPILVTAMLAHMHWRTTFLIFGSVGFVWAFAWYRWFRDEPEQHASVNQAELRHIQSGRGLDHGHHLAGVPWKRLLLNRSMLALCFMYMTQSYGFYFFMTWLPAYLEKERGFSALKLGLMTGLPMMMAILGDLFGGFTTDSLCKRFGLRIGRCAVGGISLLLAGLFMIAGTATSSPVGSAILFGLGATAGSFMLGASWGAVIDMAGGHAGVAGACMNTAGQIGGVLSPIVLAWLLGRTGAWAVPLYLMGLLQVAGGASWLLVEPSRPVVGDEAH